MIGNVRREKPIKIKHKKIYYTGILLTFYLKEQNSKQGQTLITCLNLTVKHDTRII